MVRTVPYIVVLSLLFPMSAYAEDTTTPPPQEVVAFAIDDITTIVTWVPPDVDADSFNVYGVNGTELEFITSTEEHWAFVTSAYEQYAVTSVIGGVESSAAYGMECVCVSMTPSPPYVQPETDCKTAGIRINSP